MSHGWGNKTLRLATREILNTGGAAQGVRTSVGPRPWGGKAKKGHNILCSTVEDMHEDTLLQYCTAVPDKREARQAARGEVLT